MTNVIKFPNKIPLVEKSEFVHMTMDDFIQVLTKQKTVKDIEIERRHEEHLNEIRSYEITELRRFWDEVSDETSFYEGPEGMFDCADIHRVLNEKGDGIYCAV